MKIDDIQALKLEILSLTEQKRYQEAIDKIDEFLNSGNFIYLFFILKLQLIQMLDEGFEKYGNLEDIDMMYKQLIDLDDKSVYIRIEYSYFLYSVIDDPKTALLNVKQCAEICKKYLKECEELISKCKNELSE